MTQSLGSPPPSAPRPVGVRPSYFPLSGIVGASWVCSPSSEQGLLQEVLLKPV